MPLFFKDPILGRLEDYLWEKAQKRYLDEGGSPIDDITQVSKEVKQTLQVWVNTWLSEERVRVKIAWGEFKSIVMDKTSDALRQMFADSCVEWYSVELIDSGRRRVILAAPYEVLRYKTLHTLPGLLASKIQFKDMLPETLLSLSEFAVEKYFKPVVERSRKDYANFKIGGITHPIIIVDIIPSDFYHLGDDDTASRVDMVILSTYETPFLDKDKQKKTKEKQASIDWQNRKKQTDGRPDGRRFRPDGWDLPQSFLSKIRK